MKLGIENRKQAIAAAIMVPVALGGLIYLSMQIFGGGSPSTPPPPAPAKTTATRPGTNTAATATANAKPAAKRSFANSGAMNETSPYDPTLHPEVMFAAEHLEYTGTGRNIFSAQSAPIQVAQIQKPIAPARPMMMMPVHVAPPGPPPIPLTLFGIATHTSDGTRRAFLKHGDDVFMAGVGDIVMRQYKVTQVNANSVELEDLPHNDRQVINLQN